MNRFFKYIIIATFLIFFIHSSIKEVGIKQFDKQLACMMHCNLKQLQCYGYIEKFVYDGTTESAALLNQEEYMVCFEPKREIDEFL
jgi:hypothetical protein